jgi:oxygen-independent coproporphyrinogen-3 oxidase
VIPLALYVHFPWCLRKCPYCDFNSHAVRGEIPESDYLAALLRDLDRAADAAAGRPLTSIFIGGGTPSLLSPNAVDKLIEAAAQRLGFADGIEVTLEANPGAIEAAKFAAFRSAGITRLSLGVQSFDDRLLVAIGRIHSSAEAARAAELAMRHFERVNLDLMYALPGQSPADLERDLDRALATGAGHISAYHLTVEPNTAFAAAPPPLPDDDLAADMQERVEARLAAAGFVHYETSAFARDGQRCRHNLNYWTFGDYLGIGAGAHGKTTRAGTVLREARCKHPNDYLRRDDPVDARHVVPADELAGEFMMNALRLIDGFAPSLFEARTGLPIEHVAATLAKAGDDGLLDISEARIAPTLLGQRHLNALIERFL